MNTNFRNIEYLQNGNNRQRLAYHELTKLKIFEILKEYDPLLAGTIPIEIDLPESDLDIICYCKDHTKFSNKLVQQFGNENEFKIYTTEIGGLKSTVSNFKTPFFIIEIFGQSIPSTEQNAYKHMLVEDSILKQRGEEFKIEIIKLKAAGVKTEQAFATLLNLKGDPYIELLKYDKHNNEY